MLNTHIYEYTTHLWVGEMWNVVHGHVCECHQLGRYIYLYLYLYMYIYNMLYTYNIYIPANPWGERRRPWPRLLAPPTRPTSIYVFIYVFTYLYLYVNIHIPILYIYLRVGEMWNVVHGHVSERRQLGREGGVGARHQPTHRHLVLENGALLRGCDGEDGEMRLCLCKISFHFRGSI